jgi:hypothetical protein
MRSVDLRLDQMPRKMSTSGGNPLLPCGLEMLSRSRYWRRKRWIAQHQEPRPSASEELRALTDARPERDRIKSSVSSRSERRRSTFDAIWIAVVTAAILSSCRCQFTRSLA